MQLCTFRREACTCQIIQLISELHCSAVTNALRSQSIHSKTELVCRSREFPYNLDTFLQDLLPPNHHLKLVAHPGVRPSRPCRGFLVCCSNSDCILKIVVYFTIPFCNERCTLHFTFRSSTFLIKDGCSWANLCLTCVTSTEKLFIFHINKPFQPQLRIGQSEELLSSWKLSDASMSPKPGKV